MNDNNIDYHVILIHKGPDSSTVYDFDTRLPYPTSFSNYVFKSFLVTYLLPNPPKRLISMIQHLLVCTMHSFGMILLLKKTSLITQLSDLESTTSTKSLSTKSPTMKTVPNCSCKGIFRNIQFRSFPHVE